MPTKWGQPTLYEAVPYPGAPRYFVRRYHDLGGPFGEDELLIWGYSCRSTYAEDTPKEDEVWENRKAFPSVCFSKAEPDGEFGFTPVEAVVPVECWVLEAALTDLGVEWVDPTKDVPGDRDALSRYIMEEFTPVREKWASKEWHLPEPLLSEARLHVILDVERKLKQMARDRDSRFNEFAGRGYWQWLDDDDSEKLRVFAEKMANEVVPEAFAPDPPEGDDAADLNRVEIRTEPAQRGILHAEQEARGMLQDRLDNLTFPPGTPLEDVNKFLSHSQRGAYGTNEGDVWLMGGEVGSKIRSEGKVGIIEMMVKDDVLQECAYSTDNQELIQRAIEGTQRMEAEQRAKKKVSRSRVPGMRNGMKVSVEPGVNHHFNERALAHRWEGLYGWLPVLKSMDEVEGLYPAVDVKGILSHSSDVEYPASDLLSTPELLTIQAMGMMQVAKPIWVGPTQLNALPDWFQDETQDERGLSAEACEFARDLRLPFSTVYLDFTNASGEPAWLPYIFKSANNMDAAQACLYGALVTRVDRDSTWSRRAAIFGMNTLVIVPFGVRMKLVEGGGDREVRPIHNIVDDMVYRLPDAAAMGYVQFGPAVGPKQFYGQDEVPEEPVYVLGDMSQPGQPEAVRPTLAIAHIMPIYRDGDYAVIAGTGTAQLVKRTMELLQDDPEPRLGVWPIPEDSKTMAGTKAEATVVAYQAECVLKALLLLESQNVELIDAPTSRQVRRAIARSKEERGIAQVVHIRTKRTVVKRDDKNGAEPVKRDYAYAFDRRGHYKHVTKGPHVKNVDHMKPCPIWKTRHPHTMVCRREYVPPTVVGVAEGRPYVPKSRTVDAIDE